MPVEEANALLRWYAVDKRRLPWRAEPGERADPYRVWLSEVMLQQTTVAAVIPYFEKFTRRWPTVEALAAADDAEVMSAWAGLGYYARARNLLACARAVAADHGGAFPDTEEKLRKLPGIGRYTAAAIAAIAFGRRASVVDGNVERVVSRLYAIEEPLPGAREAIYDLVDRLTPSERAGDFAQAMMDLGAGICTPRAPGCGRCPLAFACAARRRGDPERFPVKAAKAPKPRRQDVAYWLEHRGEVLLVRRPAKGLLGGMTEVPTTPWTQDFDPRGARAHAPGFAPARGHAQTRIAWRRLPGVVRHVFTHFPLELTVYAADIPARCRAPTGMRWVKLSELGGEALPSLMRKVIAHALD